MMKHQWATIITLPLTDDEIKRIHLTGRLHLTNINEERAESGSLVACLECEVTLDGQSNVEAVRRLLDGNCRGAPVGYGNDGEPIHR